MHSTKFPLVLRFQLSEQQKVKAVRVSGTEMYRKEGAGCNADLYSAVGVGYCLLVIGVNCLQYEVLNCLNCEDGGSKLQRKLVII